MSKHNEQLKNMIFGLGPAGHTAPIFYPAETSLKPVSYVSLSQRDTFGKLTLLKIIQVVLMKLWI